MYYPTALLITFTIIRNSPAHVQWWVGQWSCRAHRLIGCCLKWAGEFHIIRLDSLFLGITFSSVCCFIFVPAAAMDMRIHTICFRLFLLFIIVLHLLRRWRTLTDQQQRREEYGGGWRAAARWVGKRTSLCIWRRFCNWWRRKASQPHKSHI